MHLQLKVNTNQLFSRVVFPIALVGLSVAVVLLINALFYQAPLKAEKGVLDLQRWSFEKQPALLAGEWSFYWNQYVPPDQFNAELIQKAPGYLNFPGVWNGKDYQGKPLPLSGYGSVALKIRLASAEPYLLKVPILTNRYRLWINGEQQVYDDLQESRATHAEATHSRIFTIKPVRAAGHGYEALIVFHLLNDRHRAGGIWEPLRITEQQYQDDLTRWPKAFDAVVAFLLSCASLMVLALGREGNRLPYLCLALFAALMSVRAGSVNERLFFELFAIQSWELQQAIEHSTLFASFIFFALYSGFRFPSYFPAPMHWFVVAVNGVLLALVVLTPPSVFSHTITLFEMVVGLYIFIWLGAFLEHVTTSRPAKVMFAGGLFAIICAVNDILYSLNFIDSINLYHLGALGFIVASYFYRGELVKQGSLLEAVAFSRAQTQAIDDDHPLTPVYRAFQQQGDDKTLRELAVSALGYSLQQWQQLTREDKVEFAQVSTLWRVTNDSGTLKTRTLDKYLKEDTLPQNPRYKTISKSLSFVADWEGMAANDQEWLKRIAGILDNL